MPKMADLLLYTINKRNRACKLEWVTLILSVLTLCRRRGQRAQKAYMCFYVIPRYEDSPCRGGFGSNAILAVLSNSFVDVASFLVYNVTMGQILSVSVFNETRCTIFYSVQNLNPSTICDLQYP